jgi:[ribosomal protein S5]-alanine N-acetyltransferase
MPPSPDSKKPEKILPETTSFESARLSFVPAWEISPEDLTIQANDLDIATGIGEEFPYPYTLENAKWFLSFAQENWNKGREYSFALIDKQTKQFCGMIGFKERGLKVSNVGYWLGREFWGKGIATEALNQVIFFIKSEYPKVKSIDASAFKYNVPSQKVLENCGFTKMSEGNKDKLLRNGEKEETVNFTLQF